MQQGQNSEKTELLQYRKKTESLLLSYKSLLSREVSSHILFFGIVLVCIQDIRFMHHMSWRLREKSETEDALETRSVVTRSTTSSKRSSRTSPSMAAAKARARAEAERTRAYYVKKETELKIEKVRMEGNLTALEHEKEAAAAMAEVRVLEEAIGSLEGGSCHSGSQIVPPIDPVQRTSDYVEQHQVTLM